MVLEQSSSERTQARMDFLTCCNTSGLPGGGLCRDKVIEIIVRNVKDKLRNLHSNMKDDVIDKLIASLSTVNKIVSHDLKSIGREELGMQASYDYLGQGSFQHTYQNSFPQILQVPIFQVSIFQVMFLGFPIFLIVYNFFPS